MNGELTRTFLPSSLPLTATILHDFRHRGTRRPPESRPKSMRTSLDLGTCPVQGGELAREGGGRKEMISCCRCPSPARLAPSPPLPHLPTDTDKARLRSQLIF